MKKFQLILFCLFIISIVQVNSFILFKLVSFGGGSTSNSISTPTRTTSAPSGVQYDFSGVPRNILRRKMEFGNNILNAIAQYKTGLALEGVRVLVSATSAAPDTSISDATSTTTPSPAYTYEKSVSVRRRY